MNEYYYDDLLRIETIEQQDGFHESFHYHRYEPTPYGALETLFQQYEIKEIDHVVDFGCGKGRLNFYIHYFHGASVTGIEMDNTFYKEAMENKKSYVGNVADDTISFQCCFAQHYEVAPADNRFYFFNPFSVQIFMKVINNILLSVEEFDRGIELVLYYASDDYIYFLENQTPFERKLEVVLSEDDPRERFIVFHLAY